MRQKSCVQETLVSYDPVREARAQLKMREVEVSDFETSVQPARNFIHLSSAVPIDGATHEPRARNTKNTAMKLRKQQSRKSGVLLDTIEDRPIP